MKYLSSKLVADFERNWSSFRCIWFPPRVSSGVYFAQCLISLNGLWTIVCHFILFLFTIVLSILPLIYGLLLLTWSPSWPWSYGSWIYNYLCNESLSPLKLWVRNPLVVRCARYKIMS